MKTLFMFTLLLALPAPSRLYWAAVAPPYYRFLPDFPRIPPLPALRARHTGVRANCHAQQNTIRKDSEQN